jgi:sensor histidine kinase YesM
MITSGKTFTLDELAKVLCYQNEKFSILYNKYFYGFEKEGKSAYYLSDSVSGFFFPYKSPFNEQMVREILPKILNVPMSADFINQKVRQPT